MSFNYLIHDFPESVWVNEKEYSVNFGFKTIVAILSLFEDPLFSEQEKINNSLALFYKKVIPSGTEGYMAMMEFISCYQEIKTEKKARERAFDYEVDSSRIFSAFLQIYGIDLSKENMHWFKFMSLFENLNDGTPQIVQVMQYRVMEISSSMSKEQQAFYRKMKKEYSLKKQDESTHQNELANIFLMENIKKERGE